MKLPVTTPMMTDARPSEAGDDFGTPEEVCDLLYDFWDGTRGIDLDPCTGPTAIVRAKKMWSVGGLQLPWFTVGAADEDDAVNTVFVNNPYSRMPIWGAKIWQEVVRKSRKQELIWLPPASTSAGWWANFAAKSDAVAFTRRLNFLGGQEGQSNARFHSALVYYGPRVRRFEKIFRPITTYFSEGRSR